jgi:ribonuclease-3 family protein
MSLLPHRPKPPPEYLIILTGDEAAVYRRGRNARVNSVPQHADISQYHAATGLKRFSAGYTCAARRIRLSVLFEKIMERITDAS